jgi:hypothetical protein
LPQRPAVLDEVVREISSGEDVDWPPSKTACPATIALVGVKPRPVGTSRKLTGPEVRGQ